MRLPEVCFGTFGIKSKEILDCALQNDIRFFDTAENYEYAEIFLGEAVKDIRNSVIIATKISPEHTVSRYAIEEAINGSLTRLGTDYIDIYQVHWSHPMHDDAVIISTLRDAVQAGKIRKIGLCNHSLTQNMKYSKYLGDDFISTQDEFNLIDNTSLSQALPYKQFLAYSILKHKAMSLRVHSCIRKLSKDYGLTYSQVQLSWVASQHNCIPIFTSSNPDHIKENLATFSASTCNIHADDLLALSDIARTRVEWLDTSLITPFADTQTYCPTPDELATAISNAVRMKPIKVIRDGKKFNVVEGKARFLAYAHFGQVPAIILGE